MKREDLLKMIIDLNGVIDSLTESRSLLEKKMNEIIQAESA